MRITLSTLDAIMAFAISGPAVAAPQILALLPTAEPLPLICEKDVCRVEVASMCLQEHRKAPNSYQTYYPGEGTRLTLAVQTRSGELKKADVTGAVTLHAVRGFVAVSVGLPQHVVRDLGDGPARLSVAPLASAIPEPIAGDPNPLTKQEIANATGLLREIARATVGADTDRLTFSQALDMAVNELPYDQSVSTAHVVRLVEKIGRRHSGPAAKRATRLLSQCQMEELTGLAPDVRSCVQARKDGALSELTKKVWEATKPGS
jgi:hypothetical protein